MSKPVSNQATQIDSIYSLDQLPDEILCEIINELVKTKNISLLPVTNKFFYNLISNENSFWKKFAALYFPYSFKRNPNHPNFQSLCKKTKILGSNFVAQKSRRQNLPHLSNVNISNWVFLQKNKLIPPSWGTPYPGHYGAEWYHEDKHYIGNMDGTITILDTNNGAPLATFHAHQRPVTGLTVNNGNIVTCSLDGHVKVWDPNNLNPGQELKDIWPNNGYVFKCCIHQDGKLLLGAFTINRNVPTNALFQVDLENGTIELIGHPKGQPCCIAVQDEILCLFTSTRDLEVWDINSKKLRHTHPRAYSSSAPTCLFIHENNLFAGDPFGWITIWDFDNGKNLCRFRAYDGIVKCISMQDGKLYTEAVKENTVLWDFNFHSLSLYNREILEENRAILEKMTEAEDVNTLLKTLHHDFQKRLKQHAYQLTKSFIPTTEAIIRMWVELCTELLLDRIHGEDQKRVSELVNFLEGVDPETYRLYEYLWEIAGRYQPAFNGPAFWGKCSFCGLHTHVASIQQKEEAVLKYKQFLKERFGEDLPLFLVDLGIDSKETFSKELKCTPDTLEKVGILSIEDLHRLGVLATPVFKKFEVPKEDQADGVQTQSYKNRDAVNDALQEVSEEIQKRLQESQCFGASLFEDDQGHPIAQGLNPWALFQKEFEAERASIEEKCISPKCDYTKMIEATNGLRDRFNAQDREYQILKLRSYIHQMDAQQTWRALKEQGVSSLSAFAQKNPNVNLFTMRS